MIRLLRALSLPICGVGLVAVVSILAAVGSGPSISPLVLVGSIGLVALYALLSLPFWLLREVDTSLVGLALLAVAVAAMTTLSTTLDSSSHLHGEAFVPAVLWLTALLFHGELRSRPLRELLTLPAAMAALLAIIGSGALCWKASWRQLHAIADLAGGVLAILAAATFLVREYQAGLRRPEVFVLFTGFLGAALVWVWQGLTEPVASGWSIGFFLITGCSPVLGSFLSSRKRAKPSGSASSREHASEVLVCYTCRCGKRTFLPISELEPGWIDCCGGKSLELNIGRRRRKPLSRSSSQASRV